MLSAILTGLPNSWNKDQAHHTGSALDSGGVLQIAWLFGHEEPLAAVADPSSDALRRAGMFPVHMSEIAQRKAYTASRDEVSANSESTKNGQIFSQTESQT